MTIDEAEFHAIADKTLDVLVTTLDLTLGDELEVDMQGGILTIELPGGGQYVVNKNTPLRQIWLSSPTSGGWHFDWDADHRQWRTRHGDKADLGNVLAAELSAVTGKSLVL
jgi:frataxin